MWCLAQAVDVLVYRNTKNMVLHIPNFDALHMQLNNQYYALANFRRVNGGRNALP
jgi:hypothetical protein